MRGSATGMLTWRGAPNPSTATLLRPPFPDHFNDVLLVDVLDSEAAEALDARLRTSFHSEKVSPLSLRRCSRMKPAGGWSSVRLFRMSSYVAPPTLYERKRARVSCFTGMVVVAMAINTMVLIVLIDSCLVGG